MNDPVHLYIYLAFYGTLALAPCFAIVGVLIWMFWSALRNLLWPPKD